MAIRLDAKALVDRVRRRIQDEGSYAWTDTEILEAADDILGDVMVEIRMAGRDYDLDRIQLAQSDLTATEHKAWTWKVPPYFHAVQLVEGVRGDGEHVQPFSAVGPTHKQAGRSFHRKPAWLFRQGSGDGVLQFYGHVDAYDSIHIWFVRRYADLHHGTLEAGAAGTVTLDGTTGREGLLGLLDDTYAGMEMAMLTGTAVGQLRTIASYVGSTRVATLTEDFSPAPTAADEYALVSPVPPEFNEYVLQRIAHQLYMRSGNEDFIALQSGYLARLEDRFRQALAHRVQNEPKRLWSSRT